MDLPTTKMKGDSHGKSEDAESLQVQLHQAVDRFATSCSQLDQRLHDCMKMQTESTNMHRQLQARFEKLFHQQQQYQGRDVVDPLQHMVVLPFSTDASQALGKQVSWTGEGERSRATTASEKATSKPSAKMIMPPAFVSGGASQMTEAATPRKPEDESKLSAESEKNPVELEGMKRDSTPQVDGQDVHKHWGKRLVQSQMMRSSTDPIRTATTKEQPSHWQEVLSGIVRNSKYEAFAIALILLHCVYIGVQLEIDAWKVETDSYYTGERSEGMTTSVAVIDIFFMIGFFVEWLLRVLPGYWRFFTGKDWAWNLFDTFVVGFMLIEAVLLWSLHSAPGHSQVTLLRLFRIFRLFRLIRIIRVVKSLRELRCLMSSIVHALKNLVWTSVVVGMQLYMFGIVLTQGALDHVYDLRANAAEDERLSPRVDALLHYFGTIGRTALTLFYSISTGISWEKLVDVLSPVGAGYVAVLLFFVAVSIFAVMNVVTGVFVSTAIHVAQQDKESLIQEEIRNKEWYLKQMRQVFHEVDTNESGTLSLEEFEEALQDERVVAYLNAMSLDFADVKTLFVLLDRDTNGTIDIDEFFAGCLRFKGEARSIDIAKLQYELEWVMYNLATLLHGENFDENLPATVRKDSVAGSYERERLSSSRSPSPVRTVHTGKESIYRGASAGSMRPTASGTSGISAFESGGKLMPPGMRTGSADYEIPSPWVRVTTQEEQPMGPRATRPKSESFAAEGHNIAAASSSTGSTPCKEQEAPAQPLGDSCSDMPMKARPQKEKRRVESI
mmetsp:Transcript_21677/g.50684  ORF Transcript_21677/g.50684 Transcript_21677/m.50684 type:complete len:783 (+) Transcript_21677:100-2448(+)